MAFWENCRARSALLEYLRSGGNRQLLTTSSALLFRIHGFETCHLNDWRRIRYCSRDTRRHFWGHCLQRVPALERANLSGRAQEKQTFFPWDHTLSKHYKFMSPFIQFLECAIVHFSTVRSFSWRIEHFKKIILIPYNKFHILSWLWANNIYILSNCIIILHYNIMFLNSNVSCVLWRVLLY